MIFTIQLTHLEPRAHEKSMRVCVARVTCARCGVLFTPFGVVLFSLLLCVCAAFLPPLSRAASPLRLGWCLLPPLLWCGTASLLLPFVFVRNKLIL